MPCTCLPCHCQNTLRLWISVRWEKMLHTLDPRELRGRRIMRVSHEEFFFSHSLERCSLAVEIRNPTPHVIFFVVEKQTKQDVSELTQKIPMSQKSHVLFFFISCWDIPKFTSSCNKIDKLYSATAIFYSTSANSLPWKWGKKFLAQCVRKNEIWVNVSAASILCTKPFPGLTLNNLEKKQND